MHKILKQGVEMPLRTLAVAVKQVPAAMNAAQQQMFLREMESCLNEWRPCIVLDCSKAKHIDYTFLHLLLRCLEEAMKRNGDVRLAALSPEARELLRQVGLNRLFRSFETSDDAVDSYQRPSGSALYAAGNYSEPAEDAA
jgi:anti-sigma B factor antagonist